MVKHMCRNLLDPQVHCRKIAVCCFAYFSQSIISQIQLRTSFNAILYVMLDPFPFKINFHKATVYDLCKISEFLDLDENVNLLLTRFTLHITDTQSYVMHYGITSNKGVIKIMQMG